MSVYNPFDFFLEPAAETFPFSYEDWQLHELQPFLPRRSRDAAARAVRDAHGRSARQAHHGHAGRGDAAAPERRSLLDPDGAGRPDARGDADACLRVVPRFGLAARAAAAASGHGGAIRVRLPHSAGRRREAGRRPRRDHGATSPISTRGAKCICPGAGWIGLDPTSGLLAGEGHIPLACTPEPASAAPISGAVDECKIDVRAHHVRCGASTNRRGSPSRTRMEQWNAIAAAGHAVDDELRRHDVRLTMGGEPTFVSAEDRDGAEWNTAALGPTKRLLAADLLWRAPGSLRSARASCTSARASGTPASSCRAGRLAATGAVTASRSGSDTALIADERRD